MSKHVIPRINAGDQVQLLRDITRLPNNVTREIETHECYNDDTGHEYTKDFIVSPKPVLYAKSGEKGKVIEAFTALPDFESWAWIRRNKRHKRPKHAKVLMESGEVKTFRLTSLQVI